MVGGTWRYCIAAEDWGKSCSSGRALWDKRGDRTAALLGIWKGGYKLENAKDAEYRPVGDRPSLVLLLMEQLYTSCKFVHYFQLTSVISIIPFYMENTTKFKCNWCSQQTNVLFLLKRSFSSQLKSVVLSGQEVSARSLPHFLNGYKEAHAVSLTLFTSGERGGMCIAVWPSCGVSGFY